MLPHLDAAYSLARWLTKDDARADDAVQEAYLRAFTFFGSLRGDSRPWLLSIVRNTCYTLLRKEHFAQSATSEFQDDFYEAPPELSNPELLRVRAVNHELLHRAVSELPIEFREVLILREFQDLSYKHISEVTGLPVGTVMSRLARARQRLQAILMQQREAGVL